VLAAAVGGIVGARAYWFAEHLGDASLRDSFSGAGFTWFGGFIGGAAAVIAVARRGVPLVPLLGAAAPALALGYGIGRIACQLAGDGTYGTPSDLPWAMSYPHGEVPTTEHVHPTPVYETLTSLLIFAMLWRLRKRTTPLRLFALYLMLAGLERLLVEFIRLNEPVVLGLTQPQLFAVGMLVVGTTLLVASLQPARPAGTAAASTLA
jgi:phosphatidylglycerol---prolipoprotein diacylglyceryl transferase